MKKKIKTNKISYYEVWLHDHFQSKSNVIAKFEDEKEADKYADFLNKTEPDAINGDIKYEVKEKTMKLIESADEAIIDYLKIEIRNIENKLEDYEDYKPWSFEKQTYVPKLEKRLKDLEDQLAIYENKTEELGISD